MIKNKVKQRQDYVITARALLYPNKDWKKKAATNPKIIIWKTKKNKKTVIISPN